MESMTVWLLVMVGYAHSGGFGAVQPQMFPTAQACEHVAKSSPLREMSAFPYWRCIQTQVLVPKAKAAP
jgi:hypothetical protein